MADGTTFRPFLYLSKRVQATEILHALTLFLAVLAKLLIPGFPSKLLLFFRISFLSTESTQIPLLCIYLLLFLHVAKLIVDMVVCHYKEKKLALLRIRNLGLV